MLSGLLIKIIRFLFFHFTSPPPLVYLMFTPITTESRYTILIIKTGRNKNARTGC